MGEVAAVREPHREDGVAGAQQGGVRGEDRGGAGVRLHIGVLGAEEPLARSTAIRSATSTSSQPPW